MLLFATFSAVSEPESLRNASYFGRNSFPSLLNIEKRPRLSRYPNVYGKL